MKGALDGIRVVEAGVWITAPLAASMLADMGAEVIKIENPRGGDSLRGMTTLWGEAQTLPTGQTVLYETANRGKRSLTFDLNQSRGRDVLRKLIKSADVFVTNHSPDKARRLGIDYDTLKPWNPRLVYALVTGFGTKGPEAEKRAFDPLLQAFSGIMYQVGERDDAEVSPIRGAFFDNIGAIMCAYQVLAALVARERYGVGQMVETSQLMGAMLLQSNSVNRALMLGRPSPKRSRTRARNPLSNFYRCGDGNWLMLAEPQSDKYWHEFCEVMRLASIEKDPRFESANTRRKSFADLIALLDEAFATKPRDEWCRIFKEKNAGFAYAPILKMEDLVKHPQVTENEYVTSFDHPALGKTTLIGFPVRFSETPSHFSRPAPQLGQHTEEVLLELGYTWDDISRLRDEGAI